MSRVCYAESQAKQCLRHFKPRGVPVASFEPGICCVVPAVGSSLIWPRENPESEMDRFNKSYFEVCWDHSTCGLLLPLLVLFGDIWGHGEMAKSKVQNGLIVMCGVHIALQLVTTLASTLSSRSHLQT